MIKAKKSLGQNFLIDQNIIDKIVNILELKNKNILEIGPGTGNLTEGILRKNPKKVLVVEKDYDLTNLLRERFKKRIEIINKDILKIDENLLSNETLTVFGNLPYNISTEILCKWILNIKEKIWFDCLILMFQKEVADRIVSDFNTKNYGRLTILANWRLQIKKICDISPESFQPRPKINSTVLIFKPKKNFFLLKNSKNLEKITRVFFMHRRKMIKKPYYQLFNDDSIIAKKFGIDLKLRPQNLDFETYFKLTKEYEDLRS
ncbi:16S rRNA (adenine(1518)-N(6)/adenine(1519)-N(6))-dimethyltransferase RsmA [Candidatus Pelagibacter sp. RS39]|uniref:16S rRNA (adenine(1518)-N(6)/adenine(1519)-N(6))- dimethyltransferase RsmA n=1 Tax=Candidatus Pelagibacter sp. RS39 TaxID=1977864 RepID=UPI000A14D97C|nr:16S rRNA (adenine(1518)-N(6)/adenine(1519)-N(6))-dimethyltransferase RsmA [Candidatus Pelagibacter sp. RS39]ARJ48137.1 ribosomal RNA small subunit methyltransferase A [Candidatus Pelagibacter sp. RS39]